MDIEEEPNSVEEKTRNSMMAIREKYVDRSSETTAKEICTSTVSFTKFSVSVF